MNRDTVASICRQYRLSSVEYVRVNILCILSCMTVLLMNIFRNIKSLIKAWTFKI